MSATIEGKISFVCPNCQAHLQVPGRLAGVTGPCPKCSATIVAPAETSEPKPESAGEAEVPVKEIHHEADDSRKKGFASLRRRTKRVESLPVKSLKSISEKSSEEALDNFGEESGADVLPDLAPQTPFRDSEPELASSVQEDEAVISKGAEQSEDLEIPTEDSLGGLDWLAPPSPSAGEAEEPDSESEEIGSGSEVTSRKPIDLSRESAEDHRQSDEGAAPSDDAPRQWAWDSEGDESERRADDTEVTESAAPEAEARSETLTGESDSPSSAETEDDWLLAGPDSMPVMADPEPGELKKEEATPPHSDLESDLGELLAREEGDEEADGPPSQRSASFPKWNSLGGDTILGQVVASEKQKAKTASASSSDSPDSDSTKEPDATTETPADESDPWKAPISSTAETVVTPPDQGGDSRVPPPLVDEVERSGVEVGETGAEGSIPKTDGEAAPPSSLEEEQIISGENDAWTPPGEVPVAAVPEEAPSSLAGDFEATPWLAPGAMQQTIAAAEEVPETPPPIDEAATSPPAAFDSPNDEVPVPAGLPRFLGGTESATMEEAKPPPIDESLGLESGGEAELPAGLPAVAAMDSSLDSPILGFEDFGEGEPPRPGDPAAAPAQRISLPQIEDAVEGGARAEVSELPNDEEPLPEVAGSDLVDTDDEADSESTPRGAESSGSVSEGGTDETSGIDDSVVAGITADEEQKEGLDLSDLDLSLSSTNREEMPELESLDPVEELDATGEAEIDDGPDKTDDIAASLAGKLGGKAFSGPPETVEPEVVGESGESNSKTASTAADFSGSLAQSLSRFAPLGRRQEEPEHEDSESPESPLPGGEEDPAIGSRFEAKLAARDRSETAEDEMVADERVAPETGKASESAASQERGENETETLDEFEGSPEDEGMAKVLGLMPRKGEDEGAPEASVEETAAESESNPGDSGQSSIDELLQSGQKDFPVGPGLDWKGRFIGSESDGSRKKKLLMTGGIAAAAVVGIFGIGSIAGWFGGDDNDSNLPSGGGSTGTTAGANGSPGGGSTGNGSGGGEDVTVTVGPGGKGGGPSTLVIADPGTKPPFQLPRDEQGDGGAGSATPSTPTPPTEGSPFDAGSEVTTAGSSGKGGTAEEGVNSPQMESLINPATPDSAVGATNPEQPSTIGNGNIAWEDPPGTVVTAEAADGGGANSATPDLGVSEAIILPEVGSVDPNNEGASETEGTKPGGADGYTEIGSAGAGDTPPAGGVESVGNPDNVLDRQEENVTSVAPVGGDPEASQAAVAEDSVDLDDPLAASKHALDQFLAQPSWEERLPFIYDSDKLRPKIASYYQDVQDGPITQSVTKLFDMDEAPADGSDPFYAFYLFLEGLETEFPVIVRRTEAGYKVDWELYIECKDRLFVKFRDSEEMGPGDFRLVMQRHSYWGPDREEFTSSGEFNCYKIEAPYPDSAAFVFVGKDSALAEEIEKISTWGLPPVDVVLTLERKKFPHGVNHFVITGLAKPSWVAP